MVSYSTTFFITFISFVTCCSGLRQDEEPGERDGVHLAQGEVPEPALPDEGDVQQLRGRGGRLGLARGRFEFIHVHILPRTHEAPD